jgi:hypothetical protein
MGDLSNFRLRASLKSPPRMAGALSIGRPVPLQLASALADIHLAGPTRKTRGAGRLASDGACPASFSLGGQQ